MSRIVPRLGKLLQYSHAGGTAVSFVGNMRTRSQDTLGVEVFLPTVDCNIVDVPLIAHNDTILDGTDTYKVVGLDFMHVEGLVNARLEKQ